MLFNCAIRVYRNIVVRNMMSDYTCTESTRNESQIRFGKSVDNDNKIKLYNLEVMCILSILALI